MWEEVTKRTLEQDFEVLDRRLEAYLFDHSEEVRWEKHQATPGFSVYMLESQEAGKGQFILLQLEDGTVEVKVNKPSWTTSYLIEPIGTDKERQWQIKSLREFVKDWITWLHDQGVFDKPAGTEEGRDAVGEPARGAPVQAWLDWYHAQKNAGYKVTLKDVADKSGYSHSYVRQLHAACPKCVE